MSKQIEINPQLTWLLLKHADESLLKDLYCEFVSKETRIVKNTTDYSYKLFLLFMDNVESNKKYYRLRNFLYMLDTVIKNSSLASISVHYIKEINLIIKLIFQQKKLIYWQNAAHNSWTLTYCDFQDIKNVAFIPRTIDIESNGYALFLKKNNRRVKICGVNKFPEQIKMNKYKSMYIAFSKAIETMKNVEYCPWCYPDSDIPHSTCQRKCNNCEDISNYILGFGHTTKKKLNDNIKHTKGKNLEMTINKRGRKLLAMLQVLRNDTKFSTEFTKIENLIKQQFKLYS